jgi:hypothetical protein
MRLQGSKGAKPLIGKPQREPLPRAKTIQLATFTLTAVA